jgi:multiple sugar transport system substrate-binding protein
LFEGRRFIEKTVTERREERDVQLMLHKKTGTAMKRLSKTWSGILGIAGGLLASTAVAQAQVTTVNFWDFFTGGDGVRMTAMIQKFNDTHKDIHINATTLLWGSPFYTKVQVAAAVGQGPDLMSYHLSRLPLGVSTNTLRPFTMAELKSVGLQASDYAPHAWASAHDNGKLYAVPLDVHSIILYYNKDLLKKAGLLGADGLPTGMTGIQNFDTALAKLTGKDATYGVSVATDDGPTIWRIFYTMLAQQGGVFLQDGKILPGGNLAKAETATNAMADWVSHGWAPKLATYPASVALFTSGQAAMMINGVWEVPTMVDLAKSGKLGFQWSAIQIPVLYSQTATWCDSHSFAIPKRSGHPVSAAKLAADMTVIAWMNKNSVMWASGGHVPAYLPVTDSAAFKTMQPNAIYSSYTQTCIYDPRSVIAGVASPTYDAATNDIMPAVNGQMSTDGALQGLQSDLENDLP